MRVDDQPAKIYLSTPHMSGLEQRYIQEALDTNWVAPLGPHVDAFEREIAAYAGVDDAVAVSSGTAALHLALLLLNIRQGDVVFCSSLTFVASANPIMYVGAEPVFIDSDRDSWNMSPAALAVALEEASRSGRLPKAVIVVHLYGQLAKLREIMQLCDYYEVPIIEDAAESLGSTYLGYASGSFGKFGIYSFNGNKMITTSGGGMLVSDDVGLLKQARFLATQARDAAPHYQHSTIGYNYRMSNLLAGVGRAQLGVLDERVMARRAVFTRYEQGLSQLEGIQFMPELACSHSNRWLTTMTLNEAIVGCSAVEILQSLAAANIEARPIWKPMHLQPLYETARYYPHEADNDVSAQLFHTGICLPSSSNMTEAEQWRVIDCIHETMKRAHADYVKAKHVVS